MSTPHRAGHASGQAPNLQRRQASARTGGPRPGLLAAWGVLGIGPFLGGVVAVIAAVIIHDHAAFPNSMCNTGLGQLGQAFSNTVATDCGVATTAESMVGWLVALGVVGIVIGLGKIGLGLSGGIAALSQAQGRKSPGAAGAHTAGGSGATPAATPAAAQAPYGSAPIARRSGRPGRAAGGLGAAATSARLGPPVLVLARGLTGHRAGVSR